MGLSIPSQRWQAPDSPHVVVPRLGLSPEMLRQAGILTDPTKPDQACRRARALVAQGHYREARDLVLPHARTTEGPVNVKINEVLAHCAMAGVGTEWESLLRGLLSTHADNDDNLGVARTRRDLGLMLMHAGRLKEADRQLQQSATIFQEIGDAGGGAEVDCLRARLRLRAGYVDRALARVSRAIESLSHLNAPRRLALAQLERARVHSHRGDAEAAARDLVAAERFLGCSGNHHDRLRARLVRAECLLLVGEPRRAAQGLKRIIVDVVQLEESRIRAWVHLLLGHAVLERDPSAARRYLMRSRHLYAQLGDDYSIAECEIALARAENRIGLNARGRLKQLWQKSFAEWGRLAALMNVVRAEVEGEKSPEKARLALFKARAFASDSGDRSLMIEVDTTLRATGLVDEETSMDLTPVGGVDRSAMVEAGGLTVQDAGTATVRPEPFLIHDVIDNADTAREAARQISGGTPQGAGVVLKPPKAVGFRAGWHKVSAMPESSAS